MYGSESYSYVNASFWRFNGTEEINGKTYNKLYGIDKTLPVEDTFYLTQEELDNLCKEINVIPEFDFDKMTPDYYIRQEGQKYYMLWANEYFNSEGKPVGEYPSGQYGSNIVETLIYDFSVEPGGSYKRIDSDQTPDCWYLDENISYAGFGFDSYNTVYVEEYGEIESCNRKYTVQFNAIRGDYSDSRWGAITSLGAYGFLASPGVVAYAYSDDGYHNHGLENVRTLDGEYIFGSPYKTSILEASGMSDVIEENNEPEYFGIDGTRISGRLIPGIYIKREGTKINKVLIK